MEGSEPTTPPSLIDRASAAEKEIEAKKKFLTFFFSFLVRLRVETQQDLTA